MKKYKQLLLFPPDREKVTLKNLKKYKLPFMAKVKIDLLINQKIFPDSLRCCHGGCEACNDTIRKCFNTILAELKENTESF